MGSALTLEIGKTTELAFAPRGFRGTPITSILISIQILDARLDCAGSGTKNKLRIGTRLLGGACVHAMHTYFQCAGVDLGVVRQNSGAAPGTTPVFATCVCVHTLILIHIYAHAISTLHYISPRSEREPPERERERERERWRWNERERERRETDRDRDRQTVRERCILENVKERERERAMERDERARER